MVPLETIRSAPKVLLHDHLDGGLRPETLIELARDVGYRNLPSEEPATLARLLGGDGVAPDLEQFLEGFAHTLAVMQTDDGLERVAAECAEDLAADGVVYAEVRFAPELSTSGGLTPDEVVSAVLRGFRRGSARTGIDLRFIACAMRTGERSLEIAQLAVRHRDEAVVGFDIAGAEARYPPTRHLEAFRYLQRANFHVTIHAGEDFGLQFIWEALHPCGAERLGHGVRIVDDIRKGPDGAPRLGRLASYVRDRRIPLEICPTSNVQTGAAKSLAQHPFGLLRQLRFRVTLNTDNRLMSGITLSDEVSRVGEALDFGLDDVRWLTINAMKSAFAPFPDRLRIIEEVIKPGYARLAAGAAERDEAAAEGSDAGESVPRRVRLAAAAVRREVDRLAGDAREGITERASGRVRRVRQRAREPLPSLYEVHPEARGATARELGLRTIPTDEIQGTAVEGPAQRGGDFLPLKPMRSLDWRARWQRIQDGVDRLAALPPIEVVRFGDGYWVLDGHNRVAAALYGGQVGVDALVRELRLPGGPSEPTPTSLGAMLEGSAALRAAGAGRLSRTARKPERPPRGTLEGGEGT